jgi:alkylation response protein AidB-like acyl-CoA dehydrogenase
VLVPRAAEGARWLEEQPACDVACATLVLDDVTVTADRVLGRDAVAPLRTYRDEAAVLAAARAVGGGFAVLDRTVDYVKTRVQFERPIGTFQAVQHQLADVATSLDAAWLAVAQAASTIEQDAAPADVTRTAMTAVVAATDAFRAATLVAHQLHGGMGFVLDSPLHLWSARAVADPTLLRPRRHLLDALAPV